MFNGGQLLRSVVLFHARSTRLYVTLVVSIGLLYIRMLIAVVWHRSRALNGPKCSAEKSRGTLEHGTGGPPRAWSGDTTDSADYYHYIYSMYITILKLNCVKHTLT